MGLRCGRSWPRRRRPRRCRTSGWPGSTPPPTSRY
uniref:GYRB n=1 Tax=Arundo donax TaxID=35708 RepID=A0A0A9HCH0_ARUDO